MLSSTGNGFGVVYARASDFKLEVQPLNSAGQAVGSPRVIGQAAITASPSRQIAMVWTGSQYVVLFYHNKPQAQLVDHTGAPVGDPLVLPSCMSFSFGHRAAAWQSGRLAVVYEAGLSGPPHSGICLAVLKLK